MLKQTHANTFKYLKIYVRIVTIVTSPTLNVIYPKQIFKLYAPFNLSQNCHHMSFGTGF